MRPTVLVSCEHGGRRVPARYRSAFTGATRALESHRGWDAGALGLARELARAVEAPLFACTTTRLLVDTNRSAHHPRLFSEWSRPLPAEERERIVARWWSPHRTAVEDHVRSCLRRRGPVLHLSVHSFTPRWKGRARPVDVGFLYDSARTRERAFATAWLNVLRELRGELRLRRNQPYRGNADGFTTALRGRFEPERYLGVELEVSQRFPKGAAGPWRELREDLARSLGRVLSPESARGWLHSST